MAERRNYTNYRYGRLVVIGHSHVRYWHCVCDCGSTCIVSATNLVSGHVQSCGCFRKEVTVARMLKHGGSCGGNWFPEYAVWNTMRQRCTNPNSEKYKDYGARGIKVCKRWAKFKNFLEDMGRRPSKDYSIDRKNNDGNYCKRNCRWATRSEQQRNTRRQQRLAA